ncbi:unnamed protein product [Cuscuta epithymum]|uniref:WRKY domain-containing protein n=1 Tax=Cuscuta epithymum TaxID=186058 RepID=A0AAV0CMX6_9ASTE|nr:unnamed protein product [Cuscuta epithymum]
MDEEKDKADRGVDDLTSTDSSWAAALGGGCDTDAVYFFGTGLEKDDGNLLGDFGWSFRAENGGDGGGFARMDSDLAGNCASNDMFSVSASSAAANATPSDCCAEPAAVSAAEQTSSSSSDDGPEKSAASGGSTSRPPADTVSKVKKKGQARMKQPRFAFMTKSEVDHLEDGYRWRKYGQKAVKNSPFPRFIVTLVKCLVTQFVMHTRCSMVCVQKLLPLYEHQMHSEEESGAVLGRSDDCDHNVRRAALSPHCWVPQGWWVYG